MKENLSEVLQGNLRAWLQNLDRQGNLNFSNVGVGDSGLVSDILASARAELIVICRQSSAVLAGGWSSGGAMQAAAARVDDQILAGAH